MYRLINCSVLSSDSQNVGHEGIAGGLREVIYNKHHSIFVSCVRKKNSLFNFKLGCVILKFGLSWYTISCLSQAKNIKSVTQYYSLQQSVLEQIAL